MPEESTALLIGVIVLVLLFDYINGFHDTANAIAASISTKALSPRAAVLLAAVMNLIGALTFTGVAKTIGSGIADPFALKGGLWIVAAALLSAVLWNLWTWWKGMPSSSSHALIGALTGAVVASSGFTSLNYEGISAILRSLLFSPLIALAGGFLLMLALFWLLRNTAPARVTKRMRFLQIGAAAFQAFMHGTNDAQKAMGVITFALIAGGQQRDDEVQTWVMVACAVAIALGTATGGWRIIRTVGRRIVRLQPANGFAVDFASSLVILGATMLHLPVSTTHVAASAVIGVGAAKGVNKVKWDVAGEIVTTWLITLPSTAVGAAILYWLMMALFL